MKISIADAVKSWVHTSLAVGRGGGVFSAASIMSASLGHCPLLMVTSVTLLRRQTDLQSPGSLVVFYVSTANTG